ncbi:MAG: PepSY domain-containing protein [Alphaproteobacteria bacterium]|nr:PepSY domain-containing protein [Alphaproteobacteria bacterium]
MRFVRPVIIAAVALSLSTFGAHADWFKDETPPANAKPLSVIIKALEDQGYKTITEVSFDDGKWEVEIQQANGKEIEFAIDPVTGKMTRE